MQLVVDAFVPMEKVVLWYFVVLFGCSSVSNSSLLSVENKSKLLLDFCTDKGILWLINVFAIKCSLGKLVLFVMVPEVYYFRS